MKETNIISLIHAYQKLDQATFNRFLNSLGITSGIKKHELEGLKSLIQQLLSVSNNMSVFMHYYLGFSIPQIGKEFDLLRFGTDKIINIEIKSDSTPEKILKQQLRNHYYLSFLGKELLIYTSLSTSQKLYKLVTGTGNSKLIEVPVNELYNKLTGQQIERIENINALFDPSDYLVSPFNSTDRFMDDKYFLTDQQENIYNDVMNQLKDQDTRFIALTGNAGTGKSLLTYHIAKHAISEGLKVLILHCGSLNNGHWILKNQYNWNIFMPKDKSELADYDILIIDEAQRLYPYQFNEYVKIASKNNLKCVFSFDAKQYLRNEEHDYAIAGKIENELKCKPYKLTDKIRTNKEIAYFIRQLFDVNKNFSEISYSNIEFTYCKNHNAVKSILNQLSNEGWKTINYTPGLHSTFPYEIYSSQDRDSAHSVVGQEFDRVALVIDESFRYDKNGNLCANNAYYSQRQMLYQIITRTRKQLYIIVVNNPLMLNRIIDIVSH